MENVMVPEIILYKLINGLLVEIARDFNEESDETKTKLYRFWNGVTDGKYDYYREAVSLFTDRGADNPRRVSCRMFFDASIANVPTMHITMPSDEAVNNSIGVDESGVNDDFYEDSQEISVTLARRFGAKFHIICTSDNNREVLLMYHTLRAMIISSHRSLDLAGLQNMKISGQELRINDINMPPHIYMRGIGIHHEYDVRVPELFTEKIINQYIFNEGKPYDNDVII